MKPTLLKAILTAITATAVSTINAQTWAAIFTPGTPTGTTTIATNGISDVSFFDDQKGIVSLGYVYHLTTDGGSTWSHWKDFHPYPLMKAAYYFDAQTIIMSGGGKIYKSTNNGQTFTYKASPVSDINDIDFYGNYGVLSDHYCNAAYTNDAGETWTTVSNTTLCGNVTTLKIAEVLDANTAIIAGGNNFKFKTTNGGSTWNPISNIAGTISSLSFSDNQNGICNANNLILKTNDGGNNWTDITTAVTSLSGIATPGAVFCVDANTFYVTAGDKIYVSTNGGSSFALDFTNTNCSSCAFGKFTKGGSSLFVTVGGGGGQTKVYAKANAAVSVKEENSKYLTFNVFPNPADQTLHFSGFDVDGTMNLRIYSTDGKLIKNESLTQASFDITSLDAGMYYVKITNNKGNSATKKFIKN